MSESQNMESISLFLRAENIETEEENMKGKRQSRSWVCRLSRYQETTNECEH